MRPHTREPTRLPCPWDSPGRNTGVDDHFLLQCMKVKSESEVAQSCPTLKGRFFTRWATREALYMFAAAVAKSLQSCPTLCDPIDSSPPGSLIAGILQARTLEWVAISFSNAWKWKVKVAQSCLTRSNPMNCSLPGSSIHGIFQARVLEWGAIAFSAFRFYCRPISMFESQRHLFVWPFFFLRLIN